jgi:hypothetical protein
MNYYQPLFDRGLTTSLRDFSERFANRAHNYVASGRGLSDAAALNVIRNVWRHGCWILALRMLHYLVWGVEDGA